MTFQQAYMVQRTMAARLPRPRFTVQIMPNRNGLYYVQAADTGSVCFLSVLRGTEAEINIVMRNMLEYSRQIA